MESLNPTPFQRQLLNWFDANQRELPWRVRYMPYEIWISEIMLQQTQIKTVLPFYLRWMKRFADIQAVACAEEEEILKHWEGLGYYSRARNLHRAARVLVRDFRGEFPRDYATVRSLPGIGSYTAGAIMSLAFNADYPAVDGNVERVLSRVFDVGTPVKEKEAKAFIAKTAKELIPSGEARRFNQALMELGAMVCLPRNAACPKCPLKDLCGSFRQGLVHERPVPGKRKAAVPLEVAVGVLTHEGTVFIQKRPPKGLMAHLWEFPGGKLQEGETPEEALEREFREELELHVRCLGRIGRIHHNYTSFRVTLHAYFCELQGKHRNPVLRAAVDARWVLPEELDSYAFPAANRKLIELIRGSGHFTAQHDGKQN